MSPESAAKVERILGLLDGAIDPAEMDLPGYRLHLLRGDLAGFWSVAISGNWRIIFRFDGVQDCDVDLLDYHWEDEDVAMKNPPHPGLSVRHDCLDPLGLSVTEAAKRLGVSRKRVSDIVNCRSGISPEMAIRLSKVFGGGAETWYQLQAAYDFAQATKTADRIKLKRIERPQQAA